MNVILSNNDVRSAYHTIQSRMEYMMNRTTCVTVKQPGKGSRRILTHAVIALAISLGWIAQASALPVNGSFESGFSNWTTAGNTSVITGNLGEFSPQDGNNHALLNTWTDDITGIQPIPTDGSNGLEDLLGLVSGSLSSIAVEGSAIWTEFTVATPQTVSFRWNFLTTSPYAGSPYPGFGNDFAFVSLSSESPTPLADTFHLLLAPSTTSFSNEACTLDIFGATPCNPGINSYATGYQSGFIHITAPGTYKLGFGVVNVDLGGSGSDSLPSALLVDSVSVPEPSTGLLLVAGLVGLVLWRRSQVASV